METNLKFNSAICTSRQQSERLLALGLKKETADMMYSKTSYGEFIFVKDDEYLEHLDFPAWSLHRLICLTNPYLSINPFGNIEIGGKSFNDIYEGLISTIEYNIKEGHFNKEYLEE